jgi:hypothetical protein
MLVFVGVVVARPLVVMAAEPNDCLVWSCDRNLVPYLAEIGDVNESWGRLLPPTPGDVNDWQIDCGKFQRGAARACDPESDSFSIAYLGGTSPATVYHDPNAGTWWFTAEVLKGVNVWRFSATDAPLYAEPATSAWWVTCYGIAPQNTAPVLR